MNYLTCLLAIFFIWLALAPTAAALEVIFAVNAAGEAFHDPSSGITYEADSNSEGKKYTWPATLQFGGVDCDKQTIYKTVRYDDKKFGYDLPTVNGDYALLLHFSDDQTTIDRRVFNVVLNEKHTILTNLDVTRMCGTHNICNEVVYFSVCNGQLKVDHQVSAVQGGKIRVEFVGVKFLPLVAALAVVKGSPGDGLWIVGTKTVLYFDPKRGISCTSSDGTPINKFASDQKPPYSFLQQFFNITNFNLRVQNFGPDKPKMISLAEDELV